jgi:ADP-ribosylglycohydrolase
VTQSVNVNLNDDSEVVKYLAQLLSENGSVVDETSTKELTQMVKATSQGNMAEAKPLFQRLFGAAADGVKQVAWGVLTEIMTKQMGF